MPPCTFIILSELIDADSNEFSVSNISLQFKRHLINVCVSLRFFVFCFLSSWHGSDAIPFISLESDWNLILWSHIPKMFSVRSYKKDLQALRSHV